uniref:Uncharacterized protein n=1 Tax=Rhizophora mucronata TaxID=61149 RepID=A0A2P2NF81_RHIMU
MLVGCHIRINAFSY